MPIPSAKMNAAIYERMIAACQVLVMGILLFTLAFLFFNRAAIKVDTDLKSLSPSIVDDENIQRAIDNVSRDIERRFTIVLMSADADDVEEAAEVFVELAADYGDDFSAIDSLDKLDSLKALLVAYRFQLAAPEQQHAVADEKLLADARRELYSLGGSARLFSLVDDPFGYLNRYIFGSDLFRKSADLPIALPVNGMTHYAVPLHFAIADSAFNLDTQKRIEQELAQLKTDVQSRYSTVSFLHSGVFFFARDAAKKSQRDISLISIGSTIGVVVLLLFVFRSLLPLILPLVSITLGIGFAFTVCHLIFGFVHIITIVFGAGLIGVVIDYALHHFYHYQRGAQKAQKLLLLKALFFSLFTSIVGYAALALSDIPSLKHVALFSTLGLFAAWLTVISLGPVFAVSAYDGFFVTGLKYMLGFFGCCKPRLLFIGVFCLVALAVIVILRGIEFTDDPRLFFAPDEQLLAEEGAVGAIIGSVEPGRYFVIRGETVEQVYETAEQFSLAIGSGADALFGIQSIVPSLNEQKNNYASNASLYSKSGLATSLLTDLGVNESRIEHLVSDYVDAEKKRLFPEELIAVLGNTVPPLWHSIDNKIYAFVMISKGADTTSFAAVAKKHSDVFYINVSSMAGKSIREQRESAIFLIFVSVAFVSALVVLRYRRFHSLWLVAIPCFSIIITIATLQLLSIPLSLFHVMALFLVLGLGMDYVIFVTDLSVDSVKTLSAVVLSALTSLMSFGFLSVSSLPVVAAFGFTVLLGNALNFLGALVLSSQRKRIDLVNVLHVDK